MTFNASDGTAYKFIEGSFDCTTGYADIIKIQSLDEDLNVESTIEAGETSSDEIILQGSGWTLNETGTTTCQDLTTN
jgi:hypothetical protein